MENQDQNQPITPPTPPPVATPPSQMFPQPAEATPVSTPTPSFQPTETPSNPGFQPVEPPAPKKSRKKLFIIGSALLAIVLLIGSYFLISILADKAATTYYKDIKGQIETITKDPSYEKRAESASKPVQLAFIPLGSIISDDYKTAEASIKPAYEDLLSEGREYSENMATYMSFSDKILRPLQTALNTTISQSKDILAADSSEILQILVVRAELAQTFNTMAEDMKKMDEFKQYDKYENLIIALETASRDTSAWVNTYLEWGEKISAEAKGTVTEKLDGLEVRDESDDPRPFTERADYYVQRYEFDMKLVIRNATAIVDQMEKSDLAKTIAEQRISVDAKNLEFDKKLKAVSP